MITYQRRFIPNAAQLLRLLNDLLLKKRRNGETVNWTDSANQAFIDAKGCII